MSLSEVQALEILKAALSPSAKHRSSARVRTGIGDDAAVLQEIRGDQVCTVDSCEEGVHFLWDWMRAADVAHKSFHSALSDVVAMGGRPSFLLCHLTLGPRVTPQWLREFAKEQALCSKGTRAPIVGGNISFGSSTNVVTTVIGHVSAGTALLRSGARPGDELWLVGSVGLARAGLLLLQRGWGRARGAGAEAVALRAFRSPEAQFSLGPKLIGRAHSCLDVSDGLRRDAAQLALASEVRVIVDAGRLANALDANLIRVAERLGSTALELALEGGEDYALLASGPAARRPKGCRVIGWVEPSTRAKKPGAFLATEGHLQPLSGGFIHGRRD